MKFRWGRERVFSLSEPVMKVERKNWTDRISLCLMYVEIVTMLVASVWVWFMVSQLWQIHSWLKSL
jgi:hypothetical protein